MNVYGKTDIGLVRKTNQDDIKFNKINEDTIWAVICDGMGGVKGGDIASSLAVANISESLNEYYEQEPHTHNIEAVLRLAIVQAGDLIYETALKNQDLKGMGTTAVVAALHKKSLHLAHIGDSRAYIVNELGIEQITADHSIVQEMIKKGEITKEEALNHPQKNIITRALGIQRGALPDYTEIELNKGDKVILCTDGLTNELSDEEIYKIVKTSAQEEVPENLIKEAKTRKGADNITVAVIA